MEDLEKKPGRYANDMEETCNMEELLQCVSSL